MQPRLIVLAAGYAIFNVGCPVRAAQSAPESAGRPGLQFAVPNIAFPSNSSAPPSSARSYAAPSDPEGYFLGGPGGLPNGSLVEAVYFRFAYTTVHPTEEAIIVTTEHRAGSATLAEGVAVYSKEGKLFAHCPGWGTLPLPGLIADDLNQLEKVRATYAKAIATLAPPLGPSTDAPMNCIQVGFEGLHDKSICGNFPVGVSPLPSRVRSADGSVSNEPADWLVFDWCNRHLAYRPEVGVMTMPIPVNPLTGQTYACVHWGDAIEAIIFCYEYNRAHPNERARLVTTRVNGQSIGAAGYAGVLYTANHRLFAWNIMVGLWRMPDTLSGTNIYSIALDHAYINHMAGVYSAIWSRVHPQQPLPNGLTLNGHQFLGLGAPTIPTELPGDTDEMRLRRVYQLGQSLGIMADLGKSRRYGHNIVTLGWNVSAYNHDEEWGDRFDRKTAVYTVPNRLTDGVLFVNAYKKAHPGEVALTIPYRTEGSTKWKAVTLYTKPGEVWLHNGETGEGKLDGVARADLGDPSQLGQFGRLRLAGDLLIHNSWLAAGQLEVRELAHKDEFEPLDMSAISPEGLHKTLLAAGIPCGLLPTTRERLPDGTFHTYDIPCLVFEMIGRTFTYGPGRYCTASNGCIILP